MSKPIYVPKGKAKEYGDYAINIYTGCPHRCFYCFAPNVLRRDRETFHAIVKPRENIVEEVRKQVEREHITGQLIHLCFTCDPYPTGYDSTPTREIIKILKESGNHVQILTKGDGSSVADGLFCREIDGLFCRSSPDIIVRRRCVLSHKRRGWLQPSPSFRYSRNLALQDELYHPVINNGPAVLVCVDKRLGTGPVNQSRDAG